MSVGLVLLHGFLGSPESFQEIEARMSPAISRHIPTLYGHRGFRESDPLSEFEAETARLAHIIESDARSGPVHLVGYSLGARLALSLLIRAPNLFRSATLISGRRGLDSREEREQRLTSDLHWAEQLRTRSLEDFLDAWENQPMFSVMQQLAPDNLRRLREQRLRHDPEALAQALVGLSLSKMPGYGKELSRVRVPVTVVAGGLDEKFVALGQDLVSRVPNSKLVVVDGAGHHLLIERPDAVAATIVEGMNHDQCFMGKSQNV